MWNTLSGAGGLGGFGGGQAPASGRTPPYSPIGQSPQAQNILAQIQQLQQAAQQFPGILQSLMGQWGGQQGGGGVLGLPGTLPTPQMPGGGTLPTEPTPGMGSGIMGPQGIGAYGTPNAAQNMLAQAFAPMFNQIYSAPQQYFEQQGVAPGNLAAEALYKAFYGTESVPPSAITGAGGQGGGIDSLFP